MIVRADLPPAQQAVQGIHAALEAGRRDLIPADGDHPHLAVVLSGQEAKSAGVPLPMMVGTQNKAFFHLGYDGRPCCAAFHHIPDDVVFDRWVDVVEVKTRVVLLSAYVASPLRFHGGEPCVVPDPPMVGSVHDFLPVTSVRLLGGESRAYFASAVPAVLLPDVLVEVLDWLTAVLRAGTADFGFGNGGLSESHVSCLKMRVPKLCDIVSKMNPHPHLVFCTVPDESALDLAARRLRVAGIAHAAFREPDLGESLTAVCTVPVEPDRRRHFRRYPLFLPSPVSTESSPCLPS